jgi:hypothetical protein
VDYALVNFTDPWFEMEFKVRERRYAANMREVFSDGTWSIDEMVDDVVLFSRGEGERLIDIAENPVAMAQAEPVVLKASQARPVEERPYGYVLPMEFTWQGADGNLPKYYVKLLVRHGKNIVYAKQRPIGYNYYPTNVWEAGAAVTERYNFLLTGLIPGEYEYAIVVLPQENLGTVMDFFGKDGGERVWAKGRFVIEETRD